MRINPLTAIDFYKAGHRQQYPVGTNLVYSNFTARSDKLSNLPEEIRPEGVTFFGLQYFIKSFLIESFNNEFFRQPKDKVVAAYKRRMDASLGKDSIPVDHIEALHSLGYLPIEIRALPEGVEVPIKVPMLVIFNTHPDFFWLTNYLESVMSSYLWKPTTSATTARAYRKILDHYAARTGTAAEFVKLQGHDFSFRGMSNPEDAALSGAGHLLSFAGTDSVLAIDLLEQYYGADAEKELVGCSVPATEHSVMCMGSKESEIDTFRRLITEVYSAGIVSIVSDTWDFWRVVTEYVATLKDDILARDGKVVIRPDSGDPVKIICGDSEATGAAHKGAVECLWDIFEGTITETGHKLLDSHIGLIYGDSITPQRAISILEGLERKGFASGNVVFGIGSFTYQYVTRDTYGFAVKSTYGEINGVPREIFKDPITDNGVKKSAVGLISVKKEGSSYVMYDQQEDISNSGLLEPIFRNGNLLRDLKLNEIRKNAIPQTQPN